MAKGNQKPWAPDMRAVLKRRVAALLARGLAEHEIVQTLCAETMPGPDGMAVPNRSLTINPKTGRPYGQTTISRIKRELIAEWQRRDVEKVAEHYASLIAENTEARRAAWSAGDLAMVKSLLDQLSGWIGANKPIRMELNVGDLDAAIEAELARLAGASQGGDVGAPEEPPDPAAEDDASR